MTAFYLLCSLLLLITIIVGFWRVIKGPTTFDRMIAAQLFGTTGVAIIVLLANGFEKPDLYSVALVFALLVLVTLVGFICYCSRDLANDQFN